jgi:ABC-type multidrug transport system fused ATPase/permease subunit
MVRTRTRERVPNIDLLATNPLIKVFFLNIFSLLRVYRRRNDPNLDLLNLSSDDSAKATGQKLDRAWKKVFENKSSSPTLTRVLYEAFGSTYMKLGIWRVFWIIFMYLSAYVFFKLIVGYVAEAPPQYHKSTGFHVSINQVGAHLVAVGILISCILSSICSHQMKAECTRIGIQVRASLMVMIYRKSLRLHSVSGEMGDIVTLIGDHCNSIAEAFVNFHFLWSTSVEILVVIALSFVELKLAALPLLVILIILFPIQYFLAQYAANLSKRKTKITSERVHLTSEILTAIKLVKFYAWETYFLNRISKVRQKEMRELKLQFLTKSFLLAIVFGTPVLATIASLQTYGLIYPEEVLSGELIFTILSIFNTLRYPLLMLPNAIQTTRAATSSLQVIEDFLTKPEVVPLLLSADPPPEPGLKLLIVSLFKFVICKYIN